MTVFFDYIVKMMSRFCNRVKNAVLQFGAFFPNHPKFTIGVIYCVLWINIPMLMGVFEDPFKDYYTMENPNLVVHNNELLLNGDIVLYHFTPVDGGDRLPESTKSKNLSDWYTVGEIIFRHFDMSARSYIYKPDHINSFLIGDAPVSEDFYQYVLSKGAVKPRTNLAYDYDYALHTYKEWMAFIDSLSVMTGREFRAPTSDEWEYAAYGGKKTHGYKYAGSDNIDEVAFYRGNSGQGYLFEPKQKGRNELGLYDMSGGVWELTSSYFVDGDPSVGSTVDTASNIYKMPLLRGGDYKSPDIECEINYPGKKLPNADFLVGLRLVMEY